MYFRQNGSSTQCSGIYLQNDILRYILCNTRYEKKIHRVKEETCTFIRALRMQRSLAILVLETNMFRLSMDTLDFA